MEGGWYKRGRGQLRLWNELWGWLEREEVSRNHGEQRRVAGEMLLGLVLVAAMQSEP